MQWSTLYNGYKDFEKREFKKKKGILVISCQIKPKMYGDKRRIPTIDTKLDP